MSRDVSAKDDEFINSYVKTQHGCYLDEVIHRNWYKSWNPTDKKKKVSNRLMVLTKHRLYFFRITKLRKKLVHDEDHHLYTLARIANIRPEEVTLSFRDGPTITVDTPLAPDLMLRIRTQIDIISPTFIPKALPELDVAAERVYELPQHQLGPCNGMIDVYYAVCNQQSVRPLQAFVWFLQDLAAVNRRDFALSECPGFESISSKGTISLDMTCVLTCIRHNSYFNGLTISNLSRRSDVFHSLSAVALANRHLTKLCIRNLSVSDSSAIVDLFKSLTLNNDCHQIDVLDISYNTLHTKAVYALVDALDIWNHSLSVLNLSHCSISGKPLLELCNCLQRNLKMSLTMRELYLDRNKMTDEVCESLSVLWKRISDISPLERLSLSKTGCNMETLISAAFNFKQLSYLNVSYAKWSDTSLDALIHYISLSNALNELCMSGCALSPSAAARVMNALFYNNQLADFKLNMSHNKIKGRGVAEVTQRLTSASNLSYLDLSENEESAEELAQLITSLRSSASLKTLIVGRASEPKKRTRDVMEAMGTLVSHLANLGHVSLRGHKSCKILLSHMRQNLSVRELDITNSKLRDRGAVALAEVIRNNQTLEVLHFDYNGITANGYMAIQSALRYNQVLSLIPTPVHDLSKAKAESSRHAVLLEKLWADVQHMLALNNATRQVVATFNLPDDVHGHDSVVLREPPAAPGPAAVVPDDLARLPTPVAYRDLNKTGDEPEDDDTDPWAGPDSMVPPATPRADANPAPAPRPALATSASFAAPPAAAPHMPPPSLSTSDSNFAYGSSAARAPAQRAPPPPSQRAPVPPAPPSAAPRAPPAPLSAAPAPPAGGGGSALDGEAAALVDVLKGLEPMDNGPPLPPRDPTLEAEVDGWS